MDTIYARLRPVIAPRRVPCYASGLSHRIVAVRAVARLEKR